MIASLAGATFGSSIFAEDNFQRLTGGQIRAKFSGMELTDESHWGDIFEPTGTLRTSVHGAQDQASGRCRKTIYALIAGRSRVVDATKCGYREREWS